MINLSKLKRDLRKIDHSPDQPEEGDWRLKGG
jgi:hypothetical protein